jgi:hypothetical protein
VVLLETRADGVNLGRKRGLGLSRSASREECKYPVNSKPWWTSACRQGEPRTSNSPPRTAFPHTLSAYPGPRNHELLRHVHVALLLRGPCLLFEYRAVSYI